MRRTTMLVSLAMYAGVTAIAACSDQEKTSPTAPAAAGSFASASQSSSTIGQPTASGKPAPAPVGFTKIQIVQTAMTTVAVGTGNGAVATCPAGTTIIGGGYNWVIVGNFYFPPFVKSSQIIGNTWSVWTLNMAAGAADAAIVAFAYCAS